MSDITQITEIGVNGTMPAPVSLRDIPLKMVETNIHKNGHFSSLKEEEGGGMHSTITKRSTKEENSSNESKDAENTVIGTANPSRTSSTPTDISSDHIQHLTQPEAVSSQDKYHPHTVSSKSTIFVSRDEHDTTLKKMEDNNEELHMKKEMEKKEKESLKEECEDLHHQRQSLQKDRTESYTKLSELSEDNKNTHDKIQEIKSENREHMRRNSQLECNLQIANKQIDQLEKENEECKKSIRQLLARVEYLERFLPKTQ